MKHTLPGFNVIVKQMKRFFVEYIFCCNACLDVFMACLFPSQNLLPSKRKRHWKSVVCLF